MNVEEISFNLFLIFFYYFVTFLWFLITIKQWRSQIKITFRQNKLFADQITLQ